jgi:5-methylcytosine-specific restriction endonuclease McrA
MTEKQLRFIELYSFQKKNYPEIEKIMNISREKLSNIRKEEGVEPQIKYIQNVYNKFTGQRKESFKHDFRKFYDWYQDQDQKCGYCDVTQEELDTLFHKDRRILPYLDSKRKLVKAPKRSSGTLEIERVDSSDSYNSENIILACPLCNNAKSNLIDEESWREFFVPAMKQYYKKLLDSKM